MLILCLLGITATGCSKERGAASRGREKLVSGAPEAKASAADSGKATWSSRDAVKDTAKDAVRGTAKDSFKGAKDGPSVVGGVPPSGTKESEPPTVTIETKKCAPAVAEPVV